MNLSTKEINLIEKIKRNPAFKTKNKIILSKIMKYGLIVEVENKLFLTHKAIFLLEK